MKPSIYHVRFISAQRRFGEGLAVFKDQAINGGDHGYVYAGTFTCEGSDISARIKVKRWNPNVVSVFGPLPEYDLDLHGTLSADAATFSVAGSVTQILGTSITIEGRRISDAA